MIGRPPVAPERRFFGRVQQSDACWIWTGGKSATGYGYFRAEHGRKVYAHRWSYEFFIAEIPAGLQLDHLCRTPSCVNPWHLEPVTPRVNTLRGEGVTARLARRVDVCRRGHPLSAERLCRDCGRERQRRYRSRKKRAA